jgi:hypothetical protein
MNVFFAILSCLLLIATSVVGLDMVRSMRRTRRMGARSRQLAHVFHRAMAAKLRGADAEFVFFTKEFFQLQARFERDFPPDMHPSALLRWLRRKEAV